MTSVPNPQDRSANSVQRWEWGVIAGLVVVAATLRFCYPGRLAIEHFDEGIYASNMWFGDRPGGVYPQQHLYAPPMLPALIEWVFVFLGPSNAAAMLPNQLAGTITVVLLWWLGRSWFGPIAGLTAALLCTASDVHILLSRSALTDALLGMWWVAGLLALRRACDTGRWSHCVLAGYLVGMAWYTKYNGWMPLGITTAAVVARGVCCRSHWRETRRALKTCVIAAIIAFSVWSPWLWSLQSKGGYASVMANHRQYVVGFSGWWSSFVRQSEQLAALSRVWTAALLGIGYIAFCIAVARRAKCRPADSYPIVALPRPDAVQRSSTYWNLPRFTWNWIFSGVIIGLLLPAAGPAYFTIGALVLWWSWSAYPVTGRSAIRSDDLGYWLVAVWFLGLLVATPLYSPYLRLSLPWLLAGCCGVGIAFQLGWSSALCEGPGFPPCRFQLKWTLGRAVLCALALGLGWSLNPPRHREEMSRVVQTSPLSDHQNFTVAASELVQTIAPTQQVTNAATESTPIPAVVYVYAEPGLLFQLRNAGLINVGPVGSLQFLQDRVSHTERRVYLAVGVHAIHDAKFLAEFAVHRQQLRHVGSWAWNLGPLVALDQPECDPGSLGFNPLELARIDLYEVRDE